MKMHSKNKILFRILTAVVLIFLLLCSIIRCFSRNNPVDYFDNHKTEFNIIVDYFYNNPEINFDIYDLESEDLKEIDDEEVVNSIKNIISDGVIIEIRNCSNYSSQIEISFICSNIFVNTNDTLAIVYSTEMPQNEVSYKGDKVEYVNSYEQIEDNWYREYRK